MVQTILKYPILLTAWLLVCLSSCVKDYPKNSESPDIAELKSIKIVNAGESGNMVVEGVIDENKKTVTFPRLDTLTNFDAIKFEAEMSNGAKLNQDAYKFVFGEGESSKTGVVKVVNNQRFREYLVTLRLDIPVFGADFLRPTTFDYSNNEAGNPIYPSFVSLNVRWTGFDGENILIASRSPMGPHVLKVSDVRKNAPVPIVLAQPAGGVSPFAAGQAHGHSYASNLASSLTGKLNLFHWASPTAPAELIFSMSAAEMGAPGARHGDNMSVNLDKNGNGFIYFGDNNGGAVNVRDIIRLKVTNFTTVSDPSVLSAPLGIASYMTFNVVEGTSDYIVTGYAAPIRLVNESGSLTFALGNTAVPLNGSDARIIKFNQERYLIMTTAARDATHSVVFYVYDISRGTTNEEALTIFNEKADKSPVFQYSLMGAPNIAPGTQTGWFVTKDEEGADKTLTLFAASADAGFVLFDFPKKERSN